MKLFSISKLKRKMSGAEEMPPLLVKPEEFERSGDSSRGRSGVLFGRRLTWGGVLRFMTYWLVFMIVIKHFARWAGKIADVVTALPKDPHKAAKRILDKAPVIVSLLIIA